MVDTECTVEQEDQTIDFEQFKKKTRNNRLNQRTHDSMSQNENSRDVEIMSPEEKLQSDLEHLRELRKSPSTHRPSQNPIQSFQSKKSSRKLSILEDSRFHLWQNMKQTQRDQLLKQASKTEEETPKNFVHLPDINQTDHALKRNQSKLRNFKPITQMRSINPPKRNTSDLLSDLDIGGETHRQLEKDDLAKSIKKSTQYISPIVSSRATTNQG